MRGYSSAPGGSDRSSPTGSLDDILKRARRRYLSNLLLQQTGIALSAGAAGIFLLLLVGTQILDWQWPVAVFLVVLTFGVYRVTRRLLPLYRVAQMLDRALALEDRVSTAFYFRKMAATSPELVDIVEKQAIDRVHSVDIDRAMPLAFPRSGYWACAVAVAAVGLFAVRYGILRSLSLQQPLARISFDTFRTPPKVEAASSKKSVVQEHLEKQLQQLGMSMDDLQQEPDKSGEKPNQLPVEAVADEPGGNQKGTPGKGPNPAAEGTEQTKADEPSTGEQAGESKDEGSGQPSQSQKGQQAAKSQPKTPPKNAGDNPGVLDKMKDALANLLNKLGAKPPEGSQESASNQSQQQGGKQQLSQKGTQGQGKAQGENQPAPDPQGGNESDGADKVPGQQQQASEQDGKKPGDENSKSGMGKSDGDKNIRDAEQLAAMGKISEIFGKRAAEIQGEMSVEVPSGKQQLRTAYSRSSATHSGAITESNRNEIPLMYQTYVQRYFEEVRKAQPVKPSKPVTP
jgi:hypothetical protein